MSGAYTAPAVVLVRRDHFGQTIRGRRRALGLPQREVAARAGWDRQSVSRVETGAYSPSLDRLWGLAVALQTPLSELVADAETRMAGAADPADAGTDLPTAG